jgi:hypothetical protein
MAQYTGHLGAGRKTDVRRKLDGSLTNVERKSDERWTEVRRTLNGCWTNVGRKSDERWTQVGRTSNESRTNKAQPPLLRWQVATLHCSSWQRNAATRPAEHCSSLLWRGRQSVAARYCGEASRALQFAIVARPCNNHHEHLKNLSRLWRQLSYKGILEKLKEKGRVWPFYTTTKKLKP